MNQVEDTSSMQRERGSTPEYINPQGYKFYQSMPLKVDSYTGVGCLTQQPIIFDQEPLQKPTAKLPHFDDYDFTKKYQCAAILTEHDIEARIIATEEMKTDPDYKTFTYGEAAYFRQWEDLVRKQLQNLIKSKGAPKYRYDGATGLPITSIYQNEIYNENMRKGRRHSLNILTERLLEPQFVQEQKSRLRRKSLAIANSICISKPKLDQIANKKQTAYNKQNLQEYKMELQEESTSQQHD